MLGTGDLMHHHWLPDEWQRQAPIVTVWHAECRGRADQGWLLTGSPQASCNGND